MKQFPVTRRSWASLGATAAVCAVVALWASAPAIAQITPARQDTVSTAATSTQVVRSRQSTPAEQAAGGSQPTALVNQIQMLKQQNRQLLGQVEQLQHQLEQLKEINKEQYVALDARLKRLEGGAAPGGAASAGAATPAASAPAPTSTAAAGSADASTTASGGSAPAAGSSVAAAADSDAQQAYDTAFNALRAGDFVTSARDFRAFVQQYPHATLTPNAWYWLGESYYVTQNYQQALHAFEQVVQRFPDSRKTPGALLKKGYAQYALKQTDKARATLQAVVTRYPGSSVAKLAKQRLADMQLQKQLQ